jgi:hypothetical protein
MHGWLSHICLTRVYDLLFLYSCDCKGQDYGILQPTPEDLCKCLTIELDVADHRHLTKHVPIPNIAVQEVTIEIIHRV